MAYNYSGAFLRGQSGLTPTFSEMAVFVFFGVTLSWRFASKMYIYAHVHICNMTKVISLSDESYTELSKWKGKKSFSETVLQLTGATKKKGSLLEVIQSLGDTSALADSLEKVYAKRSQRTLRRYG